MGYYVNTEEVDILIKKEDFDAIYNRMCQLNDHDELKRGGSSPQKDYTTRYNPNKWFSWMDYNYPETCSNLQEILQQIGFEIHYDDDGNICNLWYSNKTGNEEYFLACFAGYTPDGSYIEFHGEENEDYYRFYYTDGKCFFQRANVNIVFDAYEEEMIPGVITEADTILNASMEEFRKALASKQGN